MSFKVIDTRTPTNVLQVSAEAHTFSAGAAGTVVIFRIDKRPILNSTYTGIGALGDTSFTWTTGTIFTTEVLFDKSMINNLTTFAATLANGEYAIDYNNGLFIGKKATTGTTDSCNYYTEQLNSEVTVSATIGDLNYTKIKNVAVSTGAGDVDTGTQRLTFATNDINLAAINIATTSLETKDFATETTLGTVKTNLESIETDIEATNTALGTVNTNLGTIETDIEASNTLLGTIAGDTTNIDTNLTDVVDTSAHLVRAAEQDPIFNNFISEVIASVTNATDGTYSYYTDMDTFKKVGFQISADGGSGTVTVTIEASMQDDGTAPASCTYEDVTLSLFNAASFVTTTADIYSLIDNAEVLSLYKYVKIKVVADTTGANDADWTIRSKKVY